MVNKNLMHREKILNVIRNNSSDIISIISLSNFKISLSGLDSKVYGSLVLTTKEPKLDELEIKKHINIFNFKLLVFIQIIDDENYKSEIKISSDDGKSNVIFYSVSINKFFSSDFISILSTISDDKDIDIVLISYGYSWSILKANFKKFNLNLCSINNTLKHVLSSNQHLLSKAVMILYGLNNNIVSMSFNELAKSKAARSRLFDFCNKEIRDALEINTNDNIIKKEIQKNILEEEKDYKIWHSKSVLSDFNKKNTTTVNLNQKRKAHTFTCIKSYNRIHVRKLTNTSCKQNVYSPYLKKLRELLTDPTTTDMEKQKLFDNYSNNYIKQYIQDEENLFKKFRGSFEPYSKGDIKEILKEGLNTYILYTGKTKFKTILPVSKEYGLKFILIAYSIIISYYNILGYTAIAGLIGKTVLENMCIEERKSIIKEIDVKPSSFGFKEYLEHKNIDNLMLINIGDYLISILSQYPHKIFERYYSNSKIKNKEVAKILINPDYIDSIKDNIIIPNISLPMLVKPLKWSSRSYGGYLINKDLKQSIITKTPINNHKTNSKKMIYEGANILNSTKFGVNNLLLEFLLNDGKYILDIFKAKDELQREITLKLADTLSDTPFYLTVRSDWRGRLVTESFFLSYQGSDLSTSLINFWEGEPLTDSGKYYFYIYGANNHNYNSISKASFSERIKWVSDNYNKIINLDKNLILTAENPFTFASFCLNLREFDKDPKWIIRSPIFLDATCSGIQHLAGILRELELGTNVNLVESTHSDKPSDIYTRLLEPINNAINKFGDENTEFSHFSLIKLNRKIIKRPIMTKVYNVTSYGISNQLKSAMSTSNNDINSLIANNIEDSLEKPSRSSNKYICPDKDNHGVVISGSDIMKIAEIINNEIFVVYPSLNYIYSYFIDITKIVSDLGLPLTWVTPNGMEIVQHYLKTKKSKYGISLFGGNKKKLVINSPIDVLDKSKQIQSIIPNIIHSLDATHLINVVISSIKHDYYPIVTIHDCFGTHPNKMDMLSKKVKKEFAILYTKEHFLNKFHINIISHLRANNFKVKKHNNSYKVYNDKIDEWVLLPDIPKLGDLDMKSIEKSSYMIS